MDEEVAKAESPQAPAYLDMLDEVLRPGLARLSETFVATQVGFVAACQRPDGGFAGRQGDADLYYTDFALRTLAWLAPGHAAFARAAIFLPPCRFRPATWSPVSTCSTARRLVQRQAIECADCAAWAPARSRGRVALRATASLRRFCPWDRRQ